MNPDLLIAQALVIADAAGPKVAAKSDDFPFAWEEAARTAAVRFGRRPPGVACPAAVFAGPVGRTHVAVVQVADQDSGAEPRRSPPIDPPLGFRFLVLTRKLYEALGDPFAVADKFPPDWSARGDLPPLEWDAGPPPRRTVEQIQGVLKAGDTPLLLGGAQALIDGGRLLVESPAPAGELLRGLWQLLPDRTRIDLWPATFAFSAELGFHAVALPAAPEPWPVGYLTADQARDYPEGRYELALQIAAEAGNQPELDRLFARRSSKDTLRLAIYLMIAAAVVALASKFLL
jgi:hypothetical protein